MVKEVILAVGIKLDATYIDCREVKVDQWVNLQPILEVRDW